MTLNDENPCMRLNLHRGVVMIGTVRVKGRGLIPGTDKQKFPKNVGIPVIPFMRGQISDQPRVMPRMAISLALLFRPASRHARLRPSHPHASQALIHSGILPTN